MESNRNKLSKKQLKFIKQQVNKSIDNLENKYFEGGHIRLFILRKGMIVNLNIEIPNTNILIKE